MNHSTYRMLSIRQKTMIVMCLALRGALPLDSPVEVSKSPSRFLARIASIQHLKLVIMNLLTITCSFYTNARLDCSP